MLFRSNTAGLKAAKIDESTPDPVNGKIEKDAAGKLTGVVRGAGGVAFVAARVPLPEQAEWLDNTRRLVAELNSMGITGWLDAGGRGMGPMPAQRSLGSGFVVDGSGLVLTNAHVVEGAESLTVTFLDGRQFPGTLVASDASLDLAVVRIDASGLAPLALGSGVATPVGETVIADRKSTRLNSSHT